MASRIGGNKPKKAQGFSDNSEINVVPFVDIMLVLLIIFMVAAPLATVNVAVDLPPPNPEKTIPNPKDPIFVSLQKSGEIYLGDNPIPASQLGAAITVLAKGDMENRIMVRADKQVLYGEVMRIMNIIQDYGFFKVALIAEEVV
jgi:biopolymer transport protein ExbD